MKQNTMTHCLDESSALPCKKSPPISSFTLSDSCFVPLVLFFISLTDQNFQITLQPCLQITLPELVWASRYFKMARRDRLSLEILNVNMIIFK